MSDKKFMLRLDWPPGVLSPNSRAHWTEKARAAKRYRRDCCIIAQAAGCRALNADRLKVELTFFPPDNRHRDADNLLASLKAGLDGISDATGIDDSRWHYGALHVPRSETVENGAVIAVVTPMPADEWQAIGDLAKDMLRGVVS